ncbi:MAG: restriction endonuclease subunit S [Anaerolineae bacterium]|nr:restriction endonuclease subunit S [Anaerolineae bacterium]
MSDGQSHQLPRGWTWATLGDVGAVSSGGTPPTQDPANFGGTIPWITPADLSSHKDMLVRRGSRNLTEQGLRSSSAVLLPAGTVLFSSRAPIGRVAIAANELTTNQGFKNLTPYPGVLSTYVFYYLKASKTLAESHASGTTFLELSAARFEGIPIPVPPTAEQQRIVARLDELFTRLDAAVEALQRVKAQLGRYRQAVLKAAFEGKLTEAWRQTGCQREAGASRAAGNDGALRKLHECTVLITKGESPSWQGFSYVEQGVPFVRSENVLWGYVNTASVVRVPREFHQKLSRSRLRPGDVLINLVGASIGRCGVVPRELAEANINQAVALVRPAANLLPEYLMYLLLSPPVQQYIHAQKVETARANISLTDLRHLRIWVPCLREQERIVREIERHLSLAMQVGATVDGALRRAERLRQAILRRAFEGRLVPQDPNDEPAEVLLERIRAQRAQRAAAGKRGRGGGDPSPGPSPALGRRSGRPARGRGSAPP